LPGGGTTRAGDYSVTGWAEGTFRIRRDTGTGRETVSQNSSAFAVFDPAARRFRTEGVRNLPLGEFRRRVVATLPQPAPGATR
jgi:hypothetical protein